MAQYPTRRGPVPFHEGIGEWVEDDIVDVTNVAVLDEVITTKLNEVCVEV